MIYEVIYGLTEEKLGRPLSTVTQGHSLTPGELRKVFHITAPTISEGFKAVYPLAAKEWGLTEEEAKHGSAAMNSSRAEPGNAEEMALVFWVDWGDGERVHKARFTALPRVDRLGRACGVLGAVLKRVDDNGNVEGYWVQHTPTRDEKRYQAGTCKPFETDEAAAVAYFEKIMRESEQRALRDKKLIPV